MVIPLGESKQYVWLYKGKGLASEHLSLPSSIAWSTDISCPCGHI